MTRTDDQDELSLQIEPSRAKPGDIVVLTIGDWEHRPLISGVKSELQAKQDDVWTTIYLLFALLGGPTESPYWKLPLDPGKGFVVPALGVRGPVSIKVPPVVPGESRVEREYVEGNGPEIKKYVAHGILQVE